MAAVSVVNPKADVLRKTAALAANCNAAKGLSEVLSSNLGPRGTLKMLVGGAGQVKITKDGSVLLHEMQVQHPTAAMIARAASAQDVITGDGTTSTVLLIGEIMKYSERHMAEGVHTRLLCEGIEAAQKKTMELLDEFKVAVPTDESAAKEIATSLARTALRTKLIPSLADQLTDIVVEAVHLIQREDFPVDLHMVEVLHMKRRLTTETRLVRGIVMDHGPRHPDMPKHLTNCFILTANVSLEYEKTEVNSGFFYSSAEQRDRLVESERRFTDAKVKKIIELKRKVCTLENKKTFVLLNQKGIDPPALDMLAKEGIMALRRVKRRNMERLTLACGGEPVNSVDDLSENDLGAAAEVYEQTSGEEKFTFVEGVKNPHSCTVLIKGPNDHSIAQVKDAVRDGLRAVKNIFEDGFVVPGGGAFELYAHHKLMTTFRSEVQGKAKLGVEAFANALLVIPKTLAQNSGLDCQECILDALDEVAKNPSVPVGLDIFGAGKTMSPQAAGVWDNYRVKRQLLSLFPTTAQQLLLVDEIIKAGKRMGK